MRLREKERELGRRIEEATIGGGGCDEPALSIWACLRRAFLVDTLALIKRENPEVDFKDISNILGAKWKNVTAEEKKPHEEKYQAEEEAYLPVIAKEKRETEAMKLLEEEHKQKTAMELLEQYLQFKQESEKENKKTKKEKDPLKPKHPMSAFFVFTNERRAALHAKKKSVLEIAKITGEEWKNMTEEQKGPYEEDEIEAKRPKPLP
ncbi:hypothetical protein SO802_017777 [Lithocarpus litseifolius]|uniref:HMG box domain-containing protein n=1 Tax=Lithocarpus litseifolius TaxID=425828 RepID=A0AAW2CLX2_9ROSI